MADYQGIFSSGGSGVQTIGAGTNIVVDNTNPSNPVVSVTGVALASHTHDAAAIITGTIATARLGSGTASSSTYLKGDQTYSSLDASHITVGTVATARLGTGTANSTTFLRGDQTWQTITGGVAGFIGSQNTASPNNITNASRLLVDAVSTNADAVIQPKGNGALLAQLPDNTTTGGNKRGERAVDFQTDRSQANQVASGNFAAILSGYQNRVSGSVAIIVGGNTNTITTNWSFIGSGWGNTVQGQYGSIVCGTNNTVSGEYSAIVTGQSNTLTASHSGILSGQSNSIGAGSHSAVLGGQSNNIYSTSNYSAIWGGMSNQVSGSSYSFAYGNQCWADHNFTVAGGQQTRTTKIGQRVWASGRAFANGDTQQSEEHFFTTTSDAVVKTLTAGGLALNSTTGMAIPQSGIVAYKILVTCKRFSAADFGAWEITGCAYNDAGTITLYNNTINLIHRTNASYTVNMAADSTNDTANINVTGATGHTMVWSAYATTVRSVV